MCRFFAVVMLGAGACWGGGCQRNGEGEPCTTDADCGVGESCRDARCVSPASACEVSMDCEGGQLCHQGTCIAWPTCTTDADCAPYAPYTTCGNGECLEVIPPQCLEDADCPEGEVCQNGGCTPAEPECQDTQTDQSEFRHFRFEQAPALGFCPEADSVFAASIEAQEDGGYLLDVSMLEEGQAGVDECLENLLPDLPCLVVRDLAQRRLTDAEIARARETFGTIPMQCVSFDEEICVDPCLVHVLEWDGYVTTLEAAGCYEGSAWFLDGAKYREIAGLLEDLRGE